MAATINLCGCRAPWAAVAACQSHTSPLLRRQYGRRAISTNTVAAAAAADQPQAAALGRRSLLHTLAAGAALLSAAQLAVPAPAAAADAEQVFASCAGCVAAISVLAAVGAAPATEQQLGSGIVWDALGHVVTPYAPVTRALRQAPGAQVGCGGRRLQQHQRLPGQVAPARCQAGSALCFLPSALPTTRPALDCMSAALPPRRYWLP
jgi:hypothetical protein